MARPTGVARRRVRGSTGGTRTPGPNGRSPARSPSGSRTGPSAGASRTPAAPAASWHFTLDPEDGGTRLDYRARMGPGPSGVTSVIDEHPDAEERIISGRLAEWTANMEATLDGIQGWPRAAPTPTDQVVRREPVRPSRSSAVASSRSHAAASTTSSPSISSTFRRDDAPPLIRTDPAATPSAAATASTTPRLARPSVAARGPAPPAARRGTRRRRCVTTGAGRGRCASPGQPATPTIRPRPRWR